MIRWFCALAVAALFAYMPSHVEAVDLSSVATSDDSSLPKVRPNWPVPNDRGQLFYLQRSTNPNTIVYAVRFDAAGNIDARNPAAVYWRRFADRGEAKSLKRIEIPVFGVNVRRLNDGDYSVTLKRLPQIPMRLRQTGPGQAELWARIAGRTVRPIYAHALIDESGLIPRVTGFSIFGRDPTTGRYVGETFRVRGG
ncbi:MAG: DUF4833 domain-containing protein, partial [Pseudomonadota bacterium]